MKATIILILTALTVSLQATAQDDGERPTTVPMQRVTPQEEKGDVVLVEGTVRDTQGNPLPGTAIRVRETKGGSTADEEGFEQKAFCGFSGSTAGTRIKPERRDSRGCIPYPVIAAPSYCP